MSRAAAVYFWVLSALGTASLAALSGCTQSEADPGPASLQRQVDDSGRNLALSFDGIDDYLTTGTAQFPDGHAPQTLSAWFELDDVTGKQALITVRKDFESGVELGVSDGIVTAWRVFGDRVLVAAPQAIKAGAWHHAAFTYDGTADQLFLDGALVASSENVPDKRTPTGSWLGSLDGTNDLLHGSLDDVHVFEAVRTAEQLGAEQTDGVPASEAALVLDLTFDESGGSTAYDHSPLDNDGQLGDGIEQRMPTRVRSTR